MHDKPATAPKTLKADKPKAQTANVISYHAEGAKGLLAYSANIPSGQDAIEAIKVAAEQGGKFQGVKCDRLAVIVGGSKTSDKSHHGGVEIVSWTPAVGFVPESGWEDKVANPAPAAVAAPQSKRGGGDEQP